MSAKHSEQTTADGLHIIARWSFADVPARDAFSYAAADEGGVAQVGGAAPYTYYLLTDASGPTFVQLGGGGGGSGDVVGPGSSEDEQLARFDGTTGKLIQTASPRVNDQGQVTLAETVTFNPEHDNGTQGASWTLNWNNGQKQRVTLNASTTALTITNPPGVGNFLLKIITQGNFGITWPAQVLWPNGMAPVLTNNGTDIVSFYFDGTNYYGDGGGQNYS